MNLRKPLAGLILMLAAAGLVAAQLPQSVYFKDSAPPAGACTPGSEGIVHLNSATSQWYVCESGSWVAKTIDAAVIGSGTVPTARLGSGTADATTYLRGDQAWATPPGGGGAPVGATYITQTAHVDLTAEQAMSASGTGLVLNTTGTGVLSIFAGTSCTNQFPRSLSASGAATCASVADADLASNYSGIGACGANTWASTLNDAAAPTCTQPGFSNLSGTATDTQLASNYSGVGACTNQFPRTLNDNAAPTCADVAAADFATQTANTVLAGPASGGAVDPTFRALVVADWSPLTTQGDLAYRDATTTTRLPRGTDGQCLTSNASTIVWGSCAGGGGGDNITVNGAAAADADFDDATPAAPEGTNVFWQKDALTPNNLSAYVKAATNLIAGVITTAAQSFAGAKTFLDDLVADDNVDLTADITPAQITADQNDYAGCTWGSNTICRLDADQRRAITGMTAGSDGRIAILSNLDNGADSGIVIKGENASSTAANRFNIAADIVLPPEGSASFFYDATLSRWRLLSREFFHPATVRATPLILIEALHTDVDTYAPLLGVAVSSGTNPAANAGLVTGDHPGVTRIRSSTTANSGWRIQSDAGAFRLGGGEYVEIIFNPAVFTATTGRFGFCDTTSSADCVDGAYLEYSTSGVTSGKTANFSTRSTTATNVTLSAATWYRGAISVNAAASTVTFVVWDSATGNLLWVDSLSTNIPTASGRETALGLIATNSTTTATDLLHFDMLTYFSSRALAR